jgi:hypothetical protein
MKKISFKFGVFRQICLLHGLNLAIIDCFSPSSKKMYIEKYMMAVEEDNTE